MSQGNHRRDDGGILSIFTAITDKGAVLASSGLFLTAQQLLPVQRDCTVIPVGDEEKVCPWVISVTNTPRPINTASTTIRSGFFLLIGR
jgi:hypothetical protein